jgi:hypothetical protein
VTKAALLTATDLEPEQAVWVMTTSDGLIARTTDDQLPG